MTKAIVLYLHVHQPYRVRHYTIFDAGVHHDYFDAAYDDRTSNERIIHKVAEKSYLPTNRHLLDLLNAHPEFKLSLSITGTVIEQLERWAPEALESFKALTRTGRVEIVAETYHHSLAFFYSREEFEAQVAMHREKVQAVFGQTPKVFRNTELAYNNDVAWWADKAGYKGILAEGWDKVLDWRSPNYVYQPAYTDNIRLLMKNYRLSDDIAFRFGDRDWSEWPLTADKFAHWLSEAGDATNFNLFMDYETFGEHQWSDSGIFDFLRELPREWLRTNGHTFMTVSDAIDAFEPRDHIDVPQTITWADTERDLSAWLGNSMQTSAITGLYALQEKILSTNDGALIEDWRRLQTSDHFYYMCTKWFNDGDIHAYFSPYENPYDACIAFMNAYHDLRARLIEKGVRV
ncbi:MAG TPA: glycoside hydrolase family 57 protein [Candidatus Saccharimonadales bacterium]|jgi:alpha-amylase|nr:glycoside hydrolase family 57 protein [Candidatus Saccharimonadales bacterium]